MNRFMRDTRGSAVQWFALAAVLLSVASMAGVQSLAWLSEPGRVALVAYRPVDVADRPVDSANTRRAASLSTDVDTMPTGSIPSNALVIRIR